MIIALIILIVLGVVVVAGVVLSLAAGLRPMPRFNLRLFFPTAPRNEFFDLVRTLTQAGDLWHPGRGDLPNPTGDIPSPEIPNIPME